MTHDLDDTAETRELSAAYGISLATATRWLRRGKERSIARFLARREAEYGVIKNATHGWDGERGLLGESQENTSQIVCLTRSC